MALVAPRAKVPDDDLPSESPHYIQAITELGEKNDVVVAEDIYASNGMKLVAKGAKIDSAQFTRLTQHKLAVPIDHSLVSAKPVDAAVITADAVSFLEQNPIYLRMANRTGDPLAYKHALAGIKLGAPLQMRLTVMKERRRPIYDHSVRTAMIAFFLAQRLGIPQQDWPAVLLAAICHDFGEMHTDPAVLAIGHHIAPEERRFVHVHPVTAYVLLHEMRDFPAVAAQAILHHHERLDGSGYPNDLPAAKISPLGRLLAVADVAEAVIKRFDLHRLDMLFRLNHQRFEARITNALRDLVHITSADAHQPAHEHGAAAQLSHLADLLQSWFSLRDALEKQKPIDGSKDFPLGFLFERMGTLRQLVVQAGFDPDNMASMLAIARDDPEILVELRGMLDEMDWLMQDLANEIDRRSPELAGLEMGSLKGLLGHLRPPVRASA